MNVSNALNHGLINPIYAVPLIFVPCCLNEMKVAKTWLVFLTALPMILNAQVDILSTSPSVNLDGKDLQGTGVYQDLANNGLPENNALYLFVEQENVTLGSNLVVGQVNDGELYNRNNKPVNTTIAAGTTVSSVFLHYNRNTGSGDLTGQFELNREIIGISWASGTGNASLVQSDFLGKPGTIFQSNGGNARGVFENFDSVTINGSTIDFGLRMSSAFIDQFRLILNATPYYYWDLNGSTAGAGGPTPSGIWNASNTFWSTAAKGDISTSTFAQNNIAVFSAGTDATGTYSIEKDGAESINGLNFQDGDVSIVDNSGSKGSLTLNTVNGVNPGINVDDALTATIAMEIMDNGNGIRKTGTGTLVFGTSVNRANTSITGQVDITAGTLQLDDGNNNDYLEGGIVVNGGTLLQLTTSDQIGDASDLTLNGGTFEVADANDDLGTLTLSADSTIDLSGDNAVIEFDDSSSETWSGSLLTITDWDGDRDGGGNEQIIFGTTSGGLTTDQLQRIVFINPLGFAPGNYAAVILSSGEIVPAVPEPSTYMTGAVLVIFVGYWQYRRRSLSQA